MNKRLCTCAALSFAVAFLTSAPSVIAQSPQDTRSAAVSPPARDTPEGLISLDVLVADAAGKPVSELQPADFKLFESGRVQNIISFRAFAGEGMASEPAVKIILLIDTIGLPENLAREERIAVETYLRRDGGHLAHPVSVFLLSEIGLWESGAILRLAFQADLKSATPLARSDIMIEYGPVEIGGKTYICPVRSVSIVRGRSVRVLSDWDESFMAYGPYTTMLNDISFDQYHVFRSESHMLTDFTPREH